jgi:hypothetical protein
VRAGEAAASGHGVLPEARLALARARYVRYTREGGEALFARAAEVLGEVVVESAEDQERAYAYAQLCRLHRARYDERQSPDDLARAIEHLERAVAMAGDESPAMVAYARDARFTTGRDPATLQAAITAWFAAASMAPDRYGPGLAAALSFADQSTQQLAALHALYHRLATAPDRSLRGVSEAVPEGRTRCSAAPW